MKDYTTFAEEMAATFERMSVFAAALRNIVYNDKIHGKSPAAIRPL